jgi:hypothetical protein
MPDGMVRKKRHFWCATLRYPKERTFAKTGSGQTQETLRCKTLRRDTFLQVATAVSVGGSGKDGSGGSATCNDASTRLFAAASAFGSAGATRSARVATATAAAAAAAEKTIGGGGGLQPHEVMKLRRAGLALPGEAPNPGNATDDNAGGGNAEGEGGESASNNGKNKNKKEKKKGSKWAKVRKNASF